MKKEILVQTQSLTKQYKKTTALSEVDIAVPKGSIYGLVGNNGAGKTTFLKILTGEIAPTSGEFELMGAREEMTCRRVRRRIGAIIEGPVFYPNMTAEQNLEYYRIQRGIPDREVVEKTLWLVGLSEARRKKFKNMSLGMKQRLGLGLALMGEPSLLILDEPINGLDPTGIREIRGLLQKLNQEKGITVIISSHILAELENIATEYGFLSGGRLVEQVSADELREKCQSYLQVRVTEPQKYVSLLEKELSCTSYRVMPDGSVQIFGAVGSLGDYSALAVNHSIGLLELTMKEMNLENYYLNLVGQATGKEV